MNYVQQIVCKASIGSLYVWVYLYLEDGNLKCQQLTAIIHHIVRNTS